MANQMLWQGISPRLWRTTCLAVIAESSAAPGQQRAWLLHCIPPCHTVSACFCWFQDKHYHKLDREIKAMVALRGPFVAELHGWFEDEEAIWLSMELCEGGDLFKLLGYHGGRLDEHYVCTEVSQWATSVRQSCQPQGMT
jgi:serine/threonine protein kinase